MVLFLCLAAAIRVFVFAGVFPFFNNVDEQTHFDLVMKYSRGQIPRGLDPISAESAHYIVLYGSPEYLFSPDQFSGGKFPPPLWAQPAESVRNTIQSSEVQWQARPNDEACQAPLYYVLAGMWLNLGRWCGLEGGHLLYWIRFLNIILIVGLVWVSFVAARMIFPDRRCVRLGVPLLAAFMPQDTYYSIHADVLPPLCFGAAFVSAVYFSRAAVPSPRLGAVTGLLLGATYLIKISNIGLLLVTGAMLLPKVWRLAKTGTLRSATPALTWLVFFTALPIVGWALWCESIAGDLICAAPKAVFSGGSTKPFSEWWTHRMFSLHGLGEFWPELTASFWRGEFVWFRKPLVSPTVDAFYWISSALLVGLAAISLFPGFASLTKPQRQALGFAFWCFIIMVAFVAWVSISSNFGSLFYPSREHPFLTSGRLLGGALIPFLVLYVHGLDWALGRTKREWLSWIALIGIVLLATISEIVMTRPVISSEYNWFHLPATRSAKG